MEGEEGRRGAGEGLTEEGEARQKRVRTKEYKEGTEEDGLRAQS